MRILLSCLLVVGCSSQPVPAANDVDLATSPDSVDFASDPCGAKRPGLNLYSCAYLVGSCQTPGLACLCWEGGTMVCQANQEWELLLDISNCPDLRSARSYQGLGCLGANAQCGPCACDQATKVYQCYDGGV